MNGQNKPDFYNNELSPSMQHMYGRDKLADFPLFQGGYINFGYWQDIDFKTRSLSKHDRVQSSKNLYRHVLEQTMLSSQSTVLEIGSGHGFGMEVLISDYHACRVTGLDITAEHVSIAKTKHAALLQANPQACFIQGDAHNLPFPAQAFDLLFSIEALQHLSDFRRFVQEAWRVLKPNGNLAITTFFKKQAHCETQLANFIPDVDKSIGMGPYIDDTLHNLVQAGFSKVDCYSIGEHVWEGFDAWMAQTPCLATNWGRNWLKAYQAGLIDYYVIQAHKPERPQPAKA